MGRCGVQPDIAVASEAALTKAHALAVGRLVADASDPMQRSTLNAVAMKLQSIAEADSGSANRLTNGQIVGTYALPVGPGLPVTILEKDAAWCNTLMVSPRLSLSFSKATATDAGGRAFPRAGSAVSATLMAGLSCSWRVRLAPRYSSRNSNVVRTQTAHLGVPPRLSNVCYAEN
ncbi:MAG: hypothetical protein JWN85_2887 [Gammaproteobacteria bacterium]|nr:hypothetical protein [Gammaproteobacteria bacterium]